MVKMRGEDAGRRRGLKVTNIYDHRRRGEQAEIQQCIVGCTGLSPSMMVCFPWPLWAATQPALAIFQARYCPPIAQYEEYLHICGVDIQIENCDWSHRQDILTEMCMHSPSVSQMRDTDLHLEYS